MGRRRQKKLRRRLLVSRLQKRGYMYMAWKGGGRLLGAVTINLDHPPVLDLCLDKPTTCVALGREGRGNGWEPG